MDEKYEHSSDDKAVYSSFFLLLEMLQILYLDVSLDEIKNEVHLNCTLWWVQKQLHVIQNKLAVITK